MWVRAVWIEDGTEEEGTVPSTWLRDGLLYWPNTSNAWRAMQSGKVPAASWRTFSVVKEKFRSESWNECDEYDLTTTVETEEGDSEEDVDQRPAEANRRQRKKKVMKDFITGAESGDTSIAPEPPQKKTRSNNKTPDLQIPRPPTKLHPETREKTPPQGVATDAGCGNDQNLCSPSHSTWSPKSTPDRSTTPRLKSLSPFVPRRTSSPQRCAEMLGTASTPRRSPRRSSHASDSRREERSPTGWTQRLETASMPRRSPRRLYTASMSQRSPRRLYDASDCRTTMNQQSKNDISRSRERYPLPQEVFQRKIFQCFAEIKMQIKELKEGRGVSLPGNVDDIPLRAKTYEELMSIEESLRTQEDKKKLTLALSCIGGNSNGENARGILNKLMTNETMALFSLKGKKGKRAFQNLNLFTSVRDAVVKTMACTEAAAEVAIAASIKYAPDRQGGGGRK